MFCKHCGATLKSSVTGNNIPVLVARFGGLKCFQSFHGKHVTSSGSTMICRYCGSNLKATVTGNNVPILSGQRGINCPQSPHGKHELP